MRVRKRSGGLRAMATAGAHVVLLGWDMTKAHVLSRGVLGFSIQRTRHEDGEVIWLGSMKTFESVEPNPAPGALVSSFLHPFQTFQWGDYSVSPNKAYTYRIVARTGLPGALVDDAAVNLKVTTERVDQGKHAVFFNRGSVASQEYARRFQNLPPDEVGQPAFEWLSRGLIEGLFDYIDQAGDGDELYGAFFEFKNSDVYAALKSARGRGVAITILYDGDSQKAANEEALKNSGIKSLTAAREHSGGFAHNKFLLLRQGGVSKQVWTGSTNLSQNGIYGHSNNAHIVRDEDVAEKYFAYWQTLAEDKTRKPTAEANMIASPAPPQPFDQEVTPIFSPRRNLDALDWYAKLAGGAERGLFATYAFGMNDRFVHVYEHEDNVLRFALMEKKGSGQKLKEQAAEIDRIRKLRNVTVAVGNKVELNNFDRWLEEIDRVVGEAHVLYVHTKYMLIDPLGEDPIVIVGSANFSVASTDSNDENMLVIRGNKAVADIYMGEFMRLFSHYAFRESLRFTNNQSPAAALQRKYLVASAKWINGDKPSANYFGKGTDRALRRAYFSGS